MSKIPTERVTIDIDEDVLEVAQEEAEREGTSIGPIVSRLARSGLFAERPPMTYPEGFKPLPDRPGGRIVTLGFIKRLQAQIDEEDMLRALHPDRGDEHPGSTQG